MIALIRPVGNIPAAQRHSISTESFRSCAVRELLSGFLRFDCCNRIQNCVCGCGHIACSQKLLIVVMILGWLGEVIGFVLQRVQTGSLAYDRKRLIIYIIERNVRRDPCHSSSIVV